MRELSLFSGAGGGLLGSLLLGWEPIGYVEFNDYCQRVIAQRIADRILPNAPIFGDIRTFVSEGYAAAYTGMVDVLSGGFPCQPFSVAGKRAGADDPRNMWPATLDTVRAVRPRFCFFENVPGLLASGYFERILCDLTESGYSVRWRCLSAAEVGAPHKRDRLWIVAHTKHDGQSTAKVAGSITQGSDGDAPRQETTGELEGRSKQCAHVADAEHNGLFAAERQREVAYLEQQQGWAQESTSFVEPQGGGTRPDVSGNFRNTAESGLSHGRGAQVGESRPQPQLERSTWWEVEPRLGRLADGVPDRINRLKAAGNAQVPLVAATAWRLLTEDLL